jgi:hypothetical protein
MPGMPPPAWAECIKRIKKLKDASKVQKELNAKAGRGKYLCRLFPLKVAHRRGLIGQGNFLLAFYL